MNARKTLIVLVILIVFPAVVAAGVIKPGKWEVTLELETVGLEATHRLDAQPEGLATDVKKVRPLKVSRCVSAEEAAADPPPPQPPPDSDCKVEDFKFENNVMTWKLSCPEGVTGEGKVTYTETSYEGSMKIIHGERSKTQFYRGRLVGDCDKP